MLAPFRNECLMFEILKAASDLSNGLDRNLFHVPGPNIRLYSNIAIYDSQLESGSSICRFEFCLLDPIFGRSELCDKSEAFTTIHAIQCTPPASVPIPSTSHLILLWLSLI